MSKFFKRAAAVLIACFMLMGLVACTKPGTDATTPAADGGTTAEAKDNGGDTAKSGDYVKLVVWAVGNADTADCEEVAEEVNKIAREKIGCEIIDINGRAVEDLAQEIVDHLDKLD